MERLYTDYSNKNIPIPSQNEYKLQLISKVEHLLKRMRWKTLQFQGKLESDNKETYGFKSRKCPNGIDKLSKFEDDLMLMIKNIEFRNVSNTFQDQLRNDISKINTGKAIIPADKTHNLYKMEKGDYNKYLTENITKTYKKSDMNKVNKLNFEVKKIANKLSICDRVDRLQNDEAYITKDHKKNFQTNPTFRLTNPSKTNIGKISKKVLDEINEKITSSIGVNQWKNSNAVIEWFKSILNKSKRSFIVFDIENFYPSISLTLFNNAIQFAKEICEIPDNDLSIIMHSRKTLLFNNGEPWI